MIVKAIRDLLKAEPQVYTRLALFDFGDGNEPAIFTAGPAPETCGTPHMVITPNGEGEDFGTRGHRGGEQEIGIRIYSDLAGSVSNISEIAWAVWFALERAELTLEGFANPGLDVSAPVYGSDGDGYPFFALTAKVKFIESGGSN